MRLYLASGGEIRIDREPEGIVLIVRSKSRTYTRTILTPAEAEVIIERGLKIALKKEGQTP